MGAANNLFQYLSNYLLILGANAHLFIFFDQGLEISHCLCLPLPLYASESARSGWLRLALKALCTIHSIRVNKGRVSNFPFSSMTFSLPGSVCCARHHLGLRGRILHLSMKRARSVGKTMNIPCLALLESGDKKMDSA